MTTTNCATMGLRALYSVWHRRCRHRHRVYGRMLMGKLLVYLTWAQINKYVRKCVWACEARFLSSKDGSSNICIYIAVSIHH